MDRIHTIFTAKVKNDENKLEFKFDHMYIQGMGAACQRVTDLALQATETYKGIIVIDKVMTYTVKVKDLVVNKQEKKQSGSELIDEVMIDKDE